MDPRPGIFAVALALTACAAIEPALDGALSDATSPEAQEFAGGCGAAYAEQGYVDGLLGRPSRADAECPAEDRKSYATKYSAGAYVAAFEKSNAVGVERKTAAAAPIAEAAKPEAETAKTAAAAPPKQVAPAVSERRASPALIEEAASVAPAENDAPKQAAKPVAPEPEAPSPFEQPAGVRPAVAQPEVVQPAIVAAPTAPAAPKIEAAAPKVEAPPLKPGAFDPVLQQPGLASPGLGAEGQSREARLEALGREEELLKLQLRRPFLSISERDIINRRLRTIGRQRNALSLE